MASSGLESDRDLADGLARRGSDSLGKPKLSCRTGGVQATWEVDAHFGWRCTPASLLIRRRGNVLRLRRAVGRGTISSWAAEGRPPSPEGLVRARGWCAFSHAHPAPSWGRSPARNPCRKAVSLPLWPRKRYALLAPGVSCRCQGGGRSGNTAPRTPSPMRLPCNKIGSANV